MVTIDTPYASATTESAIEEKAVKEDNIGQNPTLSEAFLNMRKNLREELRNVVNEEWVVEDTDNSRTLENID